MNTVVTSKEHILSASRELIQKEGWKAINIRNVASACNISIGSIYNYFRCKSDLVTSTVESVWHDIFQFPENRTFDHFTDCISWIFHCIQEGDAKYPGLFSLHSMSFIGIEKSDAQQRMEESWKHIQQLMIDVVKNDSNVRPNVFNDQFTPESFVDLIFTLIISSFIKKEYDPSNIVSLVQRVLY